MQLLDFMLQNNLQKLGVVIDKGISRIINKVLVMELLFP